MKTYTKTHFKCGDIHRRLLTDFPVPGLDKEIYIGFIELIHTQGKKYAEGCLGFYQYCPSLDGYGPIKDTDAPNIAAHIRKAFQGGNLKFTNLAHWALHFRIEIEKSFSSTVTEFCSKMGRLVKRGGRLDNWLYIPEMYSVTMVRIKKPRPCDITYADFLLLKEGLKIGREIFSSDEKFELA